MASFLSPGIKVTEIAKGPVAFSNIPTAIGGFLAEAQKGPANTARLVTSLTEAQEIFGARYTTGVLEDSLTSFFNNGGASCYVVRAVSSTAATALRQLTTPGAATSGSLSSNASTFPAVLAGGDTFVGVVNGGAPLTVTIVAAAATLTGATGTFAAGAAGDSLGITVAGVLGGALQTIDLSAVAANQAAYIAAINAGLVGGYAVASGGTAISLVTDQKGTGAQITIGSVGGAAGAKTGFSAATSASGTGNVVNAAATTAAELKALFDATFTGSTTTLNANNSVTWSSNTTGPSSSVKFNSGTGVGKIAGFDLVIHSGSTTGPSNTVLVTASSPGAWGNTDCQIKATRVDTTVTQTAVNAAGIVSTLDLVSVARLAVGDTISVTKGGNTQRGVVSQIITSLNRVVLASTITIPVGGYTTSDNVVLETFTLGVYTLAQSLLASFSNLRMSSLSGANYFVSRINNTYNTPITVTNSGSAAADPRPSTDAAPVAMTGGSDGAALTSSDWIGTQPLSTGIYAFDQAADVNFISIPDITSTANQATVGPISVVVPKALETYVSSRADLMAILDAPEGSSAAQVKTYVESTANLASAYEAIYWPWVKALNPITGYLDSYSPSSYIQGIIARTHQAVNIGQAPAGVTFGALTGVLDTDTRISLGSPTYDSIYPSNINAIIPLQGNGVCVMGSRTLDPTGEFGQVSVRIVFNTLKRILKDQLLFVLFQNNNDDTRSAVVRIISSLLRQWREAGILAGSTDAESFFVICDRTNNTPQVIASGKLVVRVGIAPQRPAEFLDITLEQDTRATEAAAAAQTL
jgi:phage tail sheath protein FI